MTEDIRDQIDRLQTEFQSCTKALTAIGDETRQHIIGVLLKESGDKGMRVVDITKYTNLSRPAVSHHLQIMKDAGIVKTYREKTLIYYYLDPDAKTVNTLASLMKHIQRLTQQNEGEKNA